MAEETGGSLFDRLFGGDGLLGGMFGQRRPWINSDGTVRINTNNPAGMQAAVTRAKWQDYLKRYMPLEDAVFAAASADPTADMDRSEAQVRAQAGVGRGIAARDTARAGVTLSPEQQAALSRRSGLSEALDVGAVRNVTARSLYDRNTQARGAMIGIGNKVAANADSLLGAASSAQASREAANDQLKAQQKASNMQTLGTVVGLGAALAFGI